MQQPSTLSTRQWRGRLRIASISLSLGGAMLAASGTGAGAQAGTGGEERHGAWALDVQYLQLTGRPIRRDATPSLAATLGRELGRFGGSGPAWSAEAGWLRAVRSGTTAQGATIGLSAGFARPQAGDAPSRLTIRPGLALLAGWAESRDSTAMYDWRGVPGSAEAGTSGTERSYSTVRARTQGVGATIGAEFRLSDALALSASVRQWTFRGHAMSSNRSQTLAGLGVAVRP